MTGWGSTAWRLVITFRPVIVVSLVLLLTGAGLAAAIHLPLTPSASDAMGVSAIGQMTYKASNDPRYEARVEHYLADHGLNHPQRLAMQGRSPVDIARTTLNDELRAGRTVAQWTQLGKPSNLLALQPTSHESGDLALDVARIDRAAGAALTDAQLASVQAQADALPADLRAPFAQLVHAIATSYDAQLPVATGVVARAHAATDALEIKLSDAERESTLANALAVVAAENAFREAVAGHSFPSSSTPLFADPEGLVILGGAGSDTYERTSVRRDPVLIVDLGGDDIYHTTAGSACPDLLNTVHDCNGLALSTVLDLAGDDKYAYAGIPTDADGSASLGGVGVLLDASGNDSYLASYTQKLTGFGFLWPGPVGYIDGGAQGYGLAAVGIQIDAQGADTYEADVTSTNHDIWDLAQGFGNAGGVGIIADAGGNDQWLAYGFDNNLQGFQGLYPGGTGFFGGVGVMTDGGQSNDGYHAWDNATTTDFYAYGFGAFGGTGIFVDDGGNDNYQGVESSTNPFIVPLLNCAYGTASFAGLGVFLEMGGNDTYFGDTKSPRATYTMNEGFGGPAEGEGLFLDVSGDDGHFMQSHAGNGQSYTAGRGILLGGGEGLLGNTAGVYLDAGGKDQYTGASPSRNNAAWPTGADFEAGSVPQFFVN